MPLHNLTPGTDESELSYLTRRIGGARKIFQSPNSSPPDPDHSSRLTRDTTLSATQTSHFNNLPIELQTEIFTRCRAPYPLFDPNAAPLLLCRICPSWRSLVQSTPKLWSSFGIELTGSVSDDNPQFIHLMKTVDLWLQRSGKHALSIRIFHNSLRFRRTVDSRATRLFAALVPHAHRWRDVQFTMPSSSILALEKQLPNGIPALRSLNLEVTGLWNSSARPSIGALGIPWSQLTTLNLHLDHHNLLTLSECLDLLDESTNLLSCRINADCTQFCIRSEKVTLPLLDSLHLTLQCGKQAHTDGWRIAESPEACSISFLELLELNQLSTLKLKWLVERDSNGRHWSHVHSRFTSLLRGLAPTLRSIKLAYLPIAEDEILDVLSQVPNLTHLDLRFPLNDRQNDPISDHFLRALTQAHAQIGERGAPSGFLSNLRSIMIQCNGARHSMPVLTDMIESRRISSAPHGANRRLEAFCLVSMKVVADELRRRMVGWTHAGLSVSIDDIYIY